MEQVLGICGDDNNGTLTPPRPDMLFGLVGTKVLQHLNARAIRSRVGNDIFGDYFKFTFVRNPYERVVSTYHIRKKLLPGVKMSFRGFVQKRLTGKQGFGAWTFFRSKAEKALEDQFEGQHDFISDAAGKILVDFVGKYENLCVDFKKVCDRLGLKADLPVMNQSKHESYRNYYDAETRKAVEEVYKKDIEAFGYEF